MFYVELLPFQTFISSFSKIKRVINGEEVIIKDFEKYWEIPKAYKDQISKTSKYNLTTEIEKKRNPTFQNF